MTRKEFEALLLKKGFGCYKFRYFKKIYNRNDLSSLLVRFVIFDNGSFNFRFLSMDAEERESHLLKFDNLIFEDFTEQKLDEILTQCTKIKTALEMINQIAKGE
jgi:hypothetical protein